jgi:hypothetical protein
MDSSTLAKLIACAERETKRRKLVYPRYISKGNMSLQKAKQETECMERIAEVLKELESERSRKLKSVA